MVTLRSEGIVPFKSLLVGEGRNLFVDFAAWVNSPAERG